MCSRSGSAAGVLLMIWREPCPGGELRRRVFPQHRALIGVDRDRLAVRRGHEEDVVLGALDLDTVQIDRGGVHRTVESDLMPLQRGGIGWRDAGGIGRGAGACHVPAELRPITGRGLRPKARARARGETEREQQPSTRDSAVPMRCRPQRRAHLPRNSCGPEGTRVVRVHHVEDLGLIGDELIMRDRAVASVSILCIISLVCRPRA